MAFLEVVTRTVVPARAGLLSVNVASLMAQTDDDWQQLFIEDGVGRGIPWAQEQLAEHARYLTGEYVWVLDDDNVCALPGMVAELKRIAAEHDPDLIMVRAGRGHIGIVPPDSLWGQTPECGRVDGACAIVRREVWQRYADAYRSAHYASDYDFIAALFAAGVTVYWWDVVASEAQRISWGTPA